MPGDNSWQGYLPARGAAFVVIADSQAATEAVGKQQSNCGLLCRPSAPVVAPRPSNLRPLLEPHQTSCLPRARFQRTGRHSSTWAGKQTADLTRTSLWMLVLGLGGTNRSRGGPGPASTPGMHAGPRHSIPSRWFGNCAPEQGVQTSTGGHHVGGLLPSVVACFGIRRRHLGLGLGSSGMSAAANRDRG